MNNQQIIEIKDALDITRQNMRDYGIYCAQGRAFPGIFDGLKASYRRAIYGMYKNNKHQIVKVAELASFALPYHPHPSSISGVIVSLGDGSNKLKLLVTQGNFGESAKGILPASDRYIGGYLSDLAEALLCDSVDYSHFVKGEIEKDEPEALPALLPLCFINGLTGIPSGLPVLNIPTINIDDMIDYYIDILKHKDLAFVPRKLPRPNLELDILSGEDSWKTVLETGKGSVREAPVMEMVNKVIHIYATPNNKGVDAIKKIVEKEYLLEKLDIRDESTAEMHIVVEKVPNKQCNMQEIYERLYAKLQASESFNMAFYDQDHIYVPCGFDKVVKANLGFVIDAQQRRIAAELHEFELKAKVLEIIEALKKSNHIKKLAEMTTDEAISFISTTYKTDKDTAGKVFQKPLSYLTKEHGRELVDLYAKIAEMKADQSDIYEFLIKKYKNIKKLIDAQTKNKFRETRFL